MEEPTDISKIAVSLLLLRVKPFTSSSSNYQYDFFTCYNSKSPSASVQQQISPNNFPLTSKVTAVREDNSPSFSSANTTFQLANDDVVVSTTTTTKPTTWEAFFCRLLQKDHPEKSDTSGKRVPCAATSTVNKDYYSTLIIFLLLLVLRQVTQTSYFQKNLRNNSSEDLNFNCNCT